MATRGYDLSNVAVHVTGADLAGGVATPREEVIDALGQLSVYDCVRMIGRMSAALYLSHGRYAQNVQQELIDRYAAPAPELQRRLMHLLRGGQIPFFEQQLYHLGRLSVLHADPRPPDGFGGGADVGQFLLCLFGSTDAFDEDLVDAADRDALLSWALRQTAINHNVERLILWSIYFEVLEKIWPSLPLPDVEDAFKRYTGLSINRYFAVGLALSAGLTQKTDQGVLTAEVEPVAYFEKSKIAEEDWRAFLDVAAAPAEDLRRELEAEGQEFGDTTYLSLAIERQPIIIGPAGQLFVLSLPAFERRATHGIFHILAEGAVNEGEDREFHTSPFGFAFQRWAEGCIRRGEEIQAEQPRLVADEPYGPKGNRRDTSDVVLAYERQIVAVEVVAGPLNARTITHGDLGTFEKDLEKLVDKKARQLTKRIGDIINGETAELGLTADGVVRIWPVIVTSADFPVWPLIMRTIRERMKAKRFLTHKRVGPMSIITAEELALAEAHVITTKTPFVSLISSWKSSAQTGDHSLKSFLVALERNAAEPTGYSEHHRETFEEASERIRTEIFG
jgi:hypothetical protein